MMRAVGDEQAIALGVGQHLAGKVERAALLDRQLELNRILLEHLLGAVFLHELFDVLVEHLVGAFSGDAAVVATLRIDQHQRRPGLHAVAPPDDHLRVVDNGVLHLVAQDRFTDAVGVRFVREFGRVDAEHNQDAGILGFELCEVGNGVDAVDAAQRPEIQ